MADIFKIRYQEHNVEVIKEFLKWYQKSIHVDVTIHAGGHRIVAHKLVLASNSAFFNGVFLNTKSEHSHLYFMDVPFQSMKSLIEYMYSGELVVEREFLRACLQLGDSLRVRGITDVNMDEFITEPAPVSQKMHSLINRLMQQKPLQQQQNQEELPKEPITSNQQKKLRHKSRKMLKNKARIDEKAIQQVTPKLIFKRIRNTNGYQLQQIQSPISEQNITTTTQDTPLTEAQQISNISSESSTLNILQNNETECNISETQENDAYAEIETPMDVTHEEPNIQNAPTFSEYPYQESVKKKNGHRFNSDFSQHSNSRFMSDVSKRELSNMDGDNTSSVSLNQKMLDGYRKNEPSIIPKFKITQDAMNNSHNSTLNKDKDNFKQKRRKCASRNLDQEFEKLFGDSFFGIGNKNNNKINDNNEKRSSNVNDRPNEIKNSEFLMTALTDINHRKATLEVQQPRIKNGFRRRNPICPPPDDILKNGKPSFCCALCKRVYTHKSNYRRHYMVFHKRCAEAVFQCPMCKKKFTRSDNRTHHIRRIHGYTNTASLLSEGRALYYCPICNKVFTRSYNRTFHLAEEHGIRNPSIMDKQFQ